MKLLFRLLAAALVSIAVAAPVHAAKDVVFAVASTFTTTDPYDANDTLSQAMAKSFYEGLFGFDKDMKLIPVLAESYDVSKDGKMTVRDDKGQTHQFQVSKDMAKDMKPGDKIDAKLSEGQKC